MFFKRKKPHAQDAEDTPKKEPPKRGPLGRFMHGWVYPAALGIAILLPIRSSIADWNDVPSGSMRPTILEGDRIWVNKLAYGLRVPFTHTWIARWDTPSRGEIVTFASPTDGIRLVKRVIGVPGDRIAVRNNLLFVNGKPMEQEVVKRDVLERLGNGPKMLARLSREDLEGVEHMLTIMADPPPERAGLFPLRNFPTDGQSEIVVPEGTYFMMGDNRDQSNDSRVYKTVKLDQIYGRSGYVAISFDRGNSYSPRWGRWFSKMR